MLAIRLNRVGKKNKPYFRVVLQEHTIAPGGRHVEVLGSYDPHSKKTVLKEERIKYWVEKGAQASDTVYNLLIKSGVLQGNKKKVKIPAKKVEEVKKEETTAEVKEENVSEAAAEVKAEEKVEEAKEVEAPKAE